MPLSAFTLVGADTAITPDAGKTSGSRQTYISGKAAEMSGRALRETILRFANVSGDAEIGLEGGALVIRDGAASRTIELGSLPADADGFVDRAPSALGRWTRTRSLRAPAAKPFSPPRPPKGGADGAR